MKKYMVMCLSMIPSIVMIGMDNASSNIAQIKKMEIVRRIFRNRNTAEMSTESSQADDEMSFDKSDSFSRSSSGSFPIPIPKAVVQEKLSNSIRSKHGCTPRQRESSKNLLYDLERQEREKQNFLTFEIFLIHFE